MPLNVGFPFRMNNRGGTATVNEERHVKGMLEMLLLTTPGERVNRPGFGGGLNSLVFGPARQELAATIQHALRAEILQWLHDVIDLQELRVDCQDNQISVEVAYILRSDGSAQATQFSYTT